MNRKDLHTILFISGGIIIFFIAMSIIISLINFAFGIRYGMMGGGMMMRMMGVGSLFFFLPIGVIILIIYLIFNKDYNQKKKEINSPQRDSAIRDLNQRYAKGELTREQYLIIKNDILLNK